MRKICTFCSITLLFLFTIEFTSCSSKNEEDVLLLDTSDDVISIYQNLKSQNEVSILSKIQKNSGRSSIGSIPVLTTNDIQYLSSLTQDELLEYYNNILSLFGENAIEQIEEIEYNNTSNIFKIMGGHKGINKYLNFASEYLNSVGGENELKFIIPDNLDKSQKIYYAAMAVYIDNLARPLYNILSKQDINVVNESRADRPDCKWYADYRLGLAGVGFGVEMLVGIMTGGMAVPFEASVDAASLATLTDIWLEYEACNNKLH